jgi:hypothetical protein
MPARFNAAATDKNYRAYSAYGNHSTVDDDPVQACQALVKEQKKGYCVPLDKRILPFILHSHLMPISIINIGHPYKKARLIHDASFRPEPWAVATNDMTDCSTEPPTTFGPAFDTFLLWVANLRASHPTDEIYLDEDDVGGAFRHNKYHPDVVGAHTYKLGGYGVLVTGSTFGGTNSPPNWNAVAACWQACAQWLWLQPDTVDKAQPFLPSVVFAVDPSPSDVASFSRIEIHSKVTGALDSHGRRLPPPFPHHVDDCCYADTCKHMHRTVSASAVALYDVLGYADPRVPNPLSQDKPNTTYSHTHKICSYLVDSPWSPGVQHGLSLKPGTADFVHINSLEFIVILLQLTAAMERFASLPDEIQRNLYPSGQVSDFAILLILTDNTAATKWASALSWRTENNQNLIAIYAQLLRSTSIGINTEHIPRTTNVVADFLSCPDLSLTRSSRLAQIFHQHSFLQTWPFFRPTRTLFRLLVSSLFSAPWPVPPILPARLGCFEIPCCITSGSLLI